MGHYTKITATLRLKPEAVPLVALMHELKGDERVENHWVGVAAQFAEFSKVGVFATMDRAGFIPIGFGDGEDPETALIEGVWDFSCHIKQCAEDTVTYFLHHVVPELAAEAQMLETNADGLVVNYALEGGVVREKKRYFNAF